MSGINVRDFLYDWFVERFTGIQLKSRPIYFEDKTDKNVLVKFEMKTLIS